jgi:hypothetical protein
VTILFFLESMLNVLLSVLGMVVVDSAVLSADASIGATNILLTNGALRDVPPSTVDPFRPARLVHAMSTTK